MAMLCSRVYHMCISRQPSIPVLCAVPGLGSSGTQSKINKETKLLSIVLFINDDTTEASIIISIVACFAYISNNVLFSNNSFIFHPETKKIK